MWLIGILAVVMWANAAAGQEAEADPPEVVVGERLFLETRFAEFFRANAGGDVNTTLPAGDPAVATAETTVGPSRARSPGNR